MKNDKEVENCNVVVFHRGILFQLDKKYFYTMKKMLEKENMPSNYDKQFDEAVSASLRLSNKE
ncbi:MAG: hypothetical protein RR409_13605 [Clostridium sp.]